MTAEIKPSMRGALFARLPFFTPEEKCEEKWACRMNGFYESLLCEAEKYAGDASFPRGARYRAVADCAVEKRGGKADGVRVRVNLTVTEGGRRTGSRILEHVWQRGVLTNC